MQQVSIQLSVIGTDQRIDEYFMFRDDMCDFVESTSCFADWVKQRLVLLQSSEEVAASLKEGADEALTKPTVPSDCLETISATVMCRGGYAVCEGLMVPLSTPEGTYVLEISDDVDPACRAPVVDATVPAVEFTGDVSEPTVSGGSSTDPVKPQNTAALCAAAPPIQPNTSIFVSVIAPVTA